MSTLLTISSTSNMNNNSLHKAFTSVITENMEKERNILNTLVSHDFDKWYEKDFLDFVKGETNAPSREQILKDIKDLFKV